MGRVRTPGAPLHGYASPGDFAWSGWRYRIPGGPEGGQYHGFIGPDSAHSWEGGQGGWPAGRSEITDGPQVRPSGHSLLPGQGSSFGPWDKNWGGTAFSEGQTHSDHGDHHIYRSPSEMRPRPNASGGVNVIFGHQEEATPGYAEAPGNYRSLGAAPFQADGPLITPPRYLGPPTPAPIVYTGPSPQLCSRLAYPSCPQGYTRPRGGPPCYTPAPGCIPTQGYGATNVVGQPPPFTNPGPVYMVPWTPTPVSPAPAPTVAASPGDFLPSQGQVIDGLTPGTPSAPVAPSGFTQWLAESTIFPSIENQWVLLGALGAFLMFNSGKGKR